MFVCKIESVLSEYRKRNKNNNENKKERISAEEQRQIFAFFWNWVHFCYYNDRNI